MQIQRNKAAAVWVGQSLTSNLSVIHLHGVSSTYTPKLIYSLCDQVYLEAALLSLVITSESARASGRENSSVT